MKILIQNGHVYSGGVLEKADVLVQDGVIAALGEADRPVGAEVFDATGCLVSPGFTDLHVHLRQPGFAEKETIATGTAAAAAGGFTTVCAMPNLDPVPDSPQSLAPQNALIQREARVRVLPYGAITVGEKGEALADISALAPLVAGFSDDGHGVQSAGMMEAAMKAVGAAGSFIAAHCELEELIEPGAVCVQAGSDFARAHGYTGVSAESEWAEVERDIRLCAKTRCRLHICHASTAHTFALVRSAKQQGLPVSCEVTPHNLLLGCDDIRENHGRYKMNPPLRTKEDLKAALAALLDGTIDAVATDHAPHTAEEKTGIFPKAANGIVGLETAFPALYTQLILGDILPLVQLLPLFTSGPRRVLGQGAGEIAPGEKADLTVLDLAAARPVDPECFHSKGRATPFAGWRLKGWPVLTILENQVVYRAN